MNSEDIKNLLRNGEHIFLECKKAENTIPKSLWESYSAFANTYGGTILLGIDEISSETDNSKRFIITGVSEPNKLYKDLWNTINSNEKASINLLRNEDVQTIDIENKKVIAINIPRADYTVRPVYINNNIIRGTFKRNHEGDYHCTEQEIKMMLRDANESGNDKLFLEFLLYG